MDVFFLSPFSQTIELDVYICDVVVLLNENNIKNF
jgi:hypothetical protein